MMIRAPYPGRFEVIAVKPYFDSPLPLYHFKDIDTGKEFQCSILGQNRYQVGDKLLFENSGYFGLKCTLISGDVIPDDDPLLPF